MSRFSVTAHQTVSMQVSLPNLVNKQDTSKLSYIITTVMSFQNFDCVLSHYRIVFGRLNHSNKTHSNSINILHYQNFFIIPSSLFLLKHLQIPFEKRKKEKNLSSKARNTSIRKVFQDSKILIPTPQFSNTYTISKTIKIDSTTRHI